MDLAEVILILFFIWMTFRQIKVKRKLLIKISKSKVDNFVFLFGILVLVLITYLYAKTYTNYLIGILGISMFISMWMKSGITEEGFSSMKKGVGIIKWNEISKITFINKKRIKIILNGKFMEEVFYFDRKDYKNILDIFRKKLNIKTEVIFK